MTTKIQMTISLVSLGKAKKVDVLTRKVVHTSTFFFATVNMRRKDKGREDLYLFYFAVYTDIC